MWERSELKQRGKFAFKANYWRCVLIAFILTAITAGSAANSKNESGISFEDLKNFNGFEKTILWGSVSVAFVVAILITVFIKNPLKVGCCGFFINNSYGPCDITALGDAFKGGNFLNIFLTMFLSNLFITLWSILLVFPGIMKSYSYRLVPYILADQPDMEWKDVLKLSSSMMHGNRWAAFVLDLSFIGWYILSGITGGLLGVFYVNPYKRATDAELYKTLLIG